MKKNGKFMRVLNVVLFGLSIVNAILLLIVSAISLIINGNQDVPRCREMWAGVVVVLVVAYVTTTAIRYFGDIKYFFKNDLKG